MSITDLLVFAAFLILPVAMAFLGRDDRFVALWTLLLIVPREFNARLGPVSFSLADAAFLGFLIPELPGLLRDYLKGIPKGPFGALLRALPVFLLLLAGYHLALHHPDSRRLLLRDLLTYGSIPLLLLALVRARLAWRPLHLWILAGALGVSAASTLGVAHLPALRDAYIEAHKRIHILAMDLGYFDPTNGTGPYTEIGSLRIVDFIGGFPLALGFLFLLPPLLRHAGRWALPKIPLLLAALAVLFDATLFTQSRTYPVATFGCLLLIAASGSPGARRLALAAFAVFALLLPATPEGRNALVRMGFMKRIGVEAPIVENARWPMWRQAIGTLERHPLAGLGPGATDDYPFGVRRARTDGVDNLYLTLGLKWGLGILLFLALGIAACWKDAWKAARDPSPEAALPGSLLIAGSSFLAVGLLSYPLINISFAMYLACFAGLCLNGLTMDKIIPFTAETRRTRVKN